jgi:DNA-binding CsgD family transcriptional regulator
VRLLQNEQRQEQSPRLVFSRQLYFFYEKSTGVAPFHVVAGADGEFPVEQAAGLLAMHCMVHGQTPVDYLVMVQAPERILKGLTEKAEKLLQSWHLVSPVRLTRREEDILDGLMRNLANKEIAASLNLTERTVKFHVSNLLSKFQVRGRTELAREAVRRTRMLMALPQPPVTQSPTHTPALPMRQRAIGAVLK